MSISIYFLINFSGASELKVVYILERFLGRFLVKVIQCHMHFLNSKPMKEKSNELGVQAPGG